MQNHFLKKTGPNHIGRNHGSKSGSSKTVPVVLEDVQQAFRKTKEYSVNWRRRR